MKKILLSTALTCFMGSAFATIVYTDVNPDEVVGPSNAITDPNGPGGGPFSSSDYTFGVQSGGMLNIGWNDVDQGTFVFPSNADVEFVGSVGANGAPFWNVAGLSAGIAIGSSSTFNQDNGFIVIEDFTYTGFPTGSDVYIGWTFLIGTATHYGWIRVNFDGTDLTVRDYAYEDAADTPINAGDGIPSDPNGIDNLELSDLALYPNPATDVVTIDLIGLSSDDANINIIDVAGRVVYSKGKVQAVRQQISLDGLNSGVYFVQIQSGDKQRSYKLIKK
ncbi:MAG: hypothetical protein ACI9YU_001098 [Flavobacteriales bacterium]|jgi:hypothetical protein